MKYLIHFTILLSSFTLLAEPKVVVTIKPLYSIAAQLTKGVSTPDLLMKEKVSPHHFHLLPSHIKTLKTADIVLWVGPEMETELSKTIGELDETKIITAMTLENVKLLETRGSSCGCQHHEHHHDDDHDHEKTFDPHIWTNPDNTLAIAGALKNHLIQLDEKNKAIYEANYTDFSAKIFGLKNKIKDMLKKSQTKFFIFHDALQYLEDYAGLKSEIVQGNHDTGFSLKEIINLKKMLEKSPQKCILTDEELPASKITEMLGNIPDLKIKEISPEGIYTDVGEDTYFEMMDDLIVKINACIN